MPARNATNSTNTKGEMYISVIIATGILMILTQAIVSLVFAAYDYVSFSRARTTARHIAQEEMETIRNMPFEEIGTVGGVPNGDLLQQKNVVRNGQNYEVKTSIVYVDDEFDETAPDDLVPNDYKRARIDVAWGGTAVRVSSITLLSDFAPNGVEQIIGGGTISILVINAEGEPVPQALVHIEAPSLNPPVDLELLTSNTGRVLLPGAPACTSCYRITVTKDDYSSERTYAAAEIANPINPDVSSLEGQLVEISFSIDRLSTLNLATVSDYSSGFVPLANQTLTIRGTKTIGTNEFDEDRYKVDQEITTDGSGQFTLENLEWDTYQILLPESSNRLISSSNPYLPIQVEPGESKDLSLALITTPEHSLYARFVDEALVPVASVSAVLKNQDEIVDTYVSGDEFSPDFGQAFFTNLENIQYTIEASASGFTTINETVPVNGNFIRQFVLIPQ